MHREGGELEILVHHKHAMKALHLPFKLRSVLARESYAIVTAGEAVESASVGVALRTETTV